MMHQADLFKLSHADDPASSKKAIRKHEKSGKRSTNKERVFRAVYEGPHRTANEIAFFTGMDSYEVRRRLSDLKNDGRVEHGKQRKCNVKQTTMVTWRVRL